jgi:3-dehydroquinate synthase
LLSAYRFELWAPEVAAHLDDPSHPRSVLRGLEEFREHLGGELTGTLPLLGGIGSGLEVHEMDLALVRESIRELQVVGCVAGDARVEPGTAFSVFAHLVHLDG